MHKDDGIRLRHMLDAAREAVDLAQKRSRRSLDSNREFALALIKSIEIIGEAAARVSDEGQAQLGEIPWARIIGMRNRLIHVYFDIDPDTLWETVTRDLPELIGTLEKIVSPGAP